MAERRYKVAVVGSGFGGAITGCRSAKKWPGEVVILERGKRYPRGSFPRTPHEFSRSFWNIDLEQRRRPSVCGLKQEAGLFDIRNYERMDVLVSAGLGGGSLIYANVFLMPPAEAFGERWPANLTRETLLPYYEIAKRVLGARPIPQGDDPRRCVRRADLFDKIKGRASELVDINVFFGNDYADPDKPDAPPLDLGLEEENRFGVLQTSCLYCAECMVGCNYHAKNTLDLNYLHVAEHRYGAEIRTETLVDRIDALDAAGQPDPIADGSYGYRLQCASVLDPENSTTVLADRVIVCAGTLGTTELLLRCKDYFESLPRISGRLGRYFSGNGDFNVFVGDGNQEVDPTWGPSIVQRTDYRLFDEFDPNIGFITESASYPAFVAWFVEGVKPRIFLISKLLRIGRQLLGRWISGKSQGPIGYAAAELFEHDLTHNTSVLASMGLDRSNGTMRLNREAGRLELEWPSRDSYPLYKAQLRAGREYKRALTGRSWFARLKAWLNLGPIMSAQPNWYWPYRNNFTMHPLGGCGLAEDATEGVTDGTVRSDLEGFGGVFGYKGLYVADGSLVPRATGANPAATIAALSEMVAQGITGDPPDTDL